MDPIAFLGWSVAVVGLVTLAFPVNVPLMALAYRVRRGNEGLDVEGRELWTRAALAAVGPALLSAALLGLAYLLIHAAELPRGGTLLVLVMAYLPAAVAHVTWAWGCDEFLDGLGLFLIYVLLAGLPILFAGWLAGWWRLLGASAPWLVPIPT